MQLTQVRSSSKKGSRCQKDSPDLKQKNSSYLLASKIGDFSQRNQTTCSKQLQNRKVKNQADNTQYIRNLYKKYLGKQNNNNSDRKIKTDMKDIRADKLLITQTFRQKLTYGQQPELNKIHSDAERLQSHHQPRAFRKMSNFQQIKPLLLRDNGKHNSSPKTNFYNKILDNQIINTIGNPRSTIITAMKTINKIRKKHI